MAVISIFQNRISFTVFILLFFALNSYSQVKIIFDTDIGGDADDLATLSMLNHLMKAGECELLAVMSWTTEKYAVPAIDAVNRYHDHSAIPIAVRKDGIHENPNAYNKAVADYFEYKWDYYSAPEATELYRKILAAAEDKSITIVTVGPLQNIKKLLESEADEYSNLSGPELLKRKVKEFVIMGGKFPEGDDEWNFNGNMPGVTKFVIENIPVPIVFSGFELGVKIKTGAFLNEKDPDTPLYRGYMHFSSHASWMKENFKGRILDNSSFDQTAVLYAVRGGEGTLWEKVSNGRCIPDESGGNTWDTSLSSDHSYLRLLADPAEVAQLIESLMLGDF